ncbi:MAG TPA: hypothetical protein PLA27_17680 [Anaerolineales bacterium]|nr:hypothetical protein [Anaerolineales bacterium]
MDALDIQILMMEFCECEHGELGFGHDDYCPCLAMSLDEMIAAQQTVAADSSICPSCGHIDGYHPPECMAGE